MVSLRSWTKPFLNVSDVGKVIILRKRAFIKKQDTTNTKSWVTLLLSEKHPSWKPAGKGGEKRKKKKKQGGIHSVEEAKTNEKFECKTT